MEEGDGIVSRKEAIANGVPPATFARYVRLKHLVKIRRTFPIAEKIPEDCVFRDDGALFA